MLQNETELLNNMPCGIFCFSTNGTITYVNPPLLKQLKYHAAEIVGQHVETILSLSSRIFYQTHFFPLLTLKASVNEVFMTLLAKDKSFIPVLVNGNSANNDNEVIHICACIEVQQRKKYEDEILKAKKEAEEALNKNEFLLKAQAQLESANQQLDRKVTQLRNTHNELLQLNDIVTHDLQEPIRKISIYLDILKSELPELTTKASGSVGIIVKSAIRIRKVLQNLQEYMQILVKDMQKSEVNLNELLCKQLKLLKSENDEHTFNVQVAQLPNVIADESQLSILFYEILKNAVEFKSPDRPLSLNISCTVTEENLYISTEGKYRYVEFAKIVVEDNGIGFNPIYKELIFKILKKLDYQRSGLGFGLAICNRIAENHGGFITATGIENQGAKINIHLPV